MASDFRSHHFSSMEPEPSVVSREEIIDYLHNNGMDLGGFTVDEVASGQARCRWVYDDSRTRPGGYISGPTMMTLVDLAAWVAVFTQAGIVPMALTWELHITFMRPAIGTDLVADATLLRFGRLSHIDVLVYHLGYRDEAAAHATCTYAVPLGSRSTDKESGD